MQSWRRPANRHRYNYSRALQHDLLDLIEADLLAGLVRTIPVVQLSRGIPEKDIIILGAPSLLAGINRSETCSVGLAGEWQLAGETMLHTLNLPTLIKSTVKKFLACATIYLYAPQNDFSVALC